MSRLSFVGRQRLQNAGFFVLALIGSYGMDHVSRPTWVTHLAAVGCALGGLVILFTAALCEWVVCLWRWYTGEEMPDLTAGMGAGERPAGP